MTHWPSDGCYSESNTQKKYIHPVFKVLQGSCWINWTTTCWKLLILLSLSSGSGIIFGKSLISRMLKIMWDKKQPCRRYQAPEHALGDMALCCWISFLASSRSATFLSCCLLRFSTWANMSSTARLTRASWRRQSMLKLLKKTVCAETAFAPRRPSWFTCTI